MLGGTRGGKESQKTWAWGQSLKIWMIDSTSLQQRGQERWVFKPLTLRTSLAGMILWRHYHKKHLIFGIVDVLQTQFPWKDSPWRVSWVSQARLYASLRSNSPLGNDAQEIRSTPEATMGMGVALIFWLKELGKTKEKPPKFQKLCRVTFLRRIESSFLWSGPVMRLLIGPSLSHLPCQNDSSLSLPAIHLISFINIGSPFLRAAHVGKQDLGLGRSCLHLVEYLWERTLAQRESLS